MASYVGGWVGQNNGLNSSTTPVPLVATVGTNIIHTGVRLKALAGNGGTIYFNFYVSQAAATANMTTANSFPMEAGTEESIDVGMFNLVASGGVPASYGDLFYIFFLSSTGTQGVAYWGT